MQSYKSHKVVEAAKILSAVGNPADDMTVILHLQGEKSQLNVSAQWAFRHAPNDLATLADGYYVRYADGYESWSPAKAFEEGYTRITLVTDADLSALVGEHILQFFSFTHLPPDLQEVSRPYAEQAVRIMALPRNPERTVALRKLLECKDAAVRAKLAGTMPTGTEPTRLA